MSADGENLTARRSRICELRAVRDQQDAARPMKRHRRHSIPIYCASIDTQAVHIGYQKRANAGIDFLTRRA